MNGLDARDRALVTRLVLGVTATCGMLDEVLQSHLKRGRLEPKVRDAMRLGAYELLFCDTPASAAVSQAVELVRGASPRAAGLANAVLRRVATEDVLARNEVLARVADGTYDVSDLALASGYPRWILQSICDEQGLGAARGVAQSALEPAPVYVAANECLLPAEDARRALEEQGLGPVTENLSSAFRLKNPAGLATSGLVESVRVVVADLSAQRVAAMVAPDYDATLLEVGQGRGTKSILIQNAARRHGANVEHTGVDSEEFKVRVAAERMARAGIGERVSCECMDARVLGDRGGEATDAGIRDTYDVVFVDAPCSGTGTLRRHPEITWSLTCDDVRELAALQRSILRAASCRVTPGGRLFYSTCSVLKAEDEEVVQAFVRDAGGDFELVGEPFRSFPELDGPDGHFCAELRRRPYVW